MADTTVSLGYMVKSRPILSEMTSFEPFTPPETAPIRSLIRYLSHAEVIIGQCRIAVVEHMLGVHQIDGLLRRHAQGNFAGTQTWCRLDEGIGALHGAEVGRSRNVRGA